MNSRPPLDSRMRSGAATAAILGVAGLVLFAGWALGASLTITHVDEHANGNYVASTDLSWWLMTQLSESTIPAPTPPAVSTTVGTPTVLPASTTNYVVNAATPNHDALQFSFQETTAAPTSTEVKITLNVSLGTGGSVQLVLYVETQATAPGSAITFLLYYDEGTATPSQIDLTSTSHFSQRCTAVGTCP